MNRNTIIFAGQSNTFGLGLEWEHDPILNSEEYLSKGVDLPIPRLPHYMNYWKKYRWSSLTCRELGYIEHNAQDHTNPQSMLMGGGAADTMWHLFDRQEYFKDLLNKTKYIVLEIGHIRWWDENIHGKAGGENLPNTPIEIDNYFKSKNPDQKIIHAAALWIGQYDKQKFWENTFQKVIDFEKENPEIKIIFMPWHGDSKDLLLQSNELYRKVLKNYLNIGKYGSINEFLMMNKLFVNDKALAFSGKYPILAKYGESHASTEGQKLIAEMLINHIKKLENK